MTARTADITRLDAWRETYEAEDARRVLDSILDLANELHEMVDPTGPDGRYDAMKIEQADALLERIAARITLAKQPIVMVIRDLELHRIAS